MEFHRDLINQNNRARQKYVVSEDVHNFSIGVTVQNCRGVAEIMFPGSQLFAFLPVAQGILGALLWPCWKYLNPSYIFTQSTAALRKGWCSVQKTSLTCKRDSKTSCEVICGEVMRC